METVCIVLHAVSSLLLLEKQNIVLQVRLIILEFMTPEGYCYGNTDIEFKCFKSSLVAL